MQKFIFLTVLFILSSCSFSSKEPVVIYENLGEYSDQNIRQIIGFMEILDTDTVYPIIYDILTRSEKLCIWKDYVWYRECFLVYLSEEQKKIINNTKMHNHEKETIYNSIDLFEYSLRQEISFLELYREVDSLASLWAWEDNSKCRLAWYRTFGQDFFITGSSVVLSYHSSQKELSHILSKSQDLNPKSLSWMYIHENPCGFYTFWPDAWNIFYFSQVWKNQYFFIKTSDGGWSGEFHYTIYHNHGFTGEEKYTPIATFPAYGWATPFPQIMRDEEWNEVGMIHYEIITEFRNLPFQYMTLFEAKRTGYIYQIARMLDDVTP